MRKIILIDVDETLTDKNYKLTVSHSVLKAAVARAQTRGYEIGLNSDSSLMTLQHQAELWGMKGPIIAEKGGVILANIACEPFYTIKEAEYFFTFRKKVVERLMDDNKYLVVTGSVNTIANKLPSYSAVEVLPQVSILINSLRLRSFSCYVRERVDNKWQTTTRSLDEVVNILLEIGVENGVECQWNIDKNILYGICIIHHRLTEKSIATEQFTVDSNVIYMIGNSMSDYLGDKKIIHCGVANASSDFKACCQFIAKEKRTAGVIELIKKITEENYNA